MSGRELSIAINEKLQEVSAVFSEFQNTTGLLCPKECGRCCFKSDISCSPYELLPMAYDLIDKGCAEEVLLKAKNYSGKACVFLEISDEQSGTGRCSEYQFRPFICRAFGISARRGKYGQIEKSICKTLSEVQKMDSRINYADNEIPSIDSWKKNLESLDPNLLEVEVPINVGLVIILEKLLLIKSLSEEIIPEF